MQIFNFWLICSPRYQLIVVLYRILTNRVQAVKEMQWKNLCRQQKSCVHAYVCMLHKSNRNYRKYLCCYLQEHLFEKVWWHWCYVRKCCWLLTFFSLQDSKESLKDSHHASTSYDTNTNGVVKAKRGIEHIEAEVIAATNCQVKIKANL